MALIKIICRTCGSDDVTRDGLLRWSVEEQVWEVVDVLDNANCNECGDETRLKEVRITEGAST